MRDEVRGPGGGRARWVAAAQAVCTGRARLKAGGHRARAGRTWNMPPNTVTLDVSRLSGWLNATALCRVERRACDAERGAGRKATGRGAAAAQAACTGRARLKAGGQGTRRGTRGAHPEHVAHVRDAGRVEGQRLVERLRFLPSRKAGIQRQSREVRGCDATAAHAACTERARLKAGGQGTRG